MKILREQSRVGLLLAASALAGALVISLMQFNSSVQAGVRKDEETEVQHFKSGGARSEIVLIEIAATLKRIDQRLERMEKLAGQSAARTADEKGNGTTRSSR